jgi:hypothetical protein
MVSPAACNQGRQLLAVAGGNGAAAIHPAGQVGQLDVEDRCLQGVEAAVVAQGRVQVAAGHAVHRQLLDGLGQGGVLAGDGTAVAGAPQVLGGKEAEAAGIAPAAHGLAVPAGAGGLGAVFDHLEAAGAGDGADPRHVHRAAKQVDRQQRFGGRGDRGLGLIQIDQVADRVHVDKHRRGAHGADRFGGGKEAEAGGDHLIAGADAQAPQRQDQGIGATVAAHRMGHAAGRGKGLLKDADRRPADVLAPAQHLEHRLVQVVTELLELLAEAEGGHLHGANLKPSC